MNKFIRFLVWGHGSFYYTFYKWNKKTYGEVDLPVVTSLLLAALFSFLNVVTLILIFERISQKKLFEFIVAHSVYNYTIIILVLILNVVFFVYGKRYKRIIEHFSNEDILERKRRRRYFGCYISLSILVFIITLFTF